MTDRYLAPSSFFKPRDHRNAVRICLGETARRIAHKGIWVKPELLAKIEYKTNSAEGKVRHPFFKGLREDL